MSRVPKLSVPVAPRRPLRIPSRYKVYDVSFVDARRPVPPKYVDTQIMASNERMALKYYKDRLGPGLGVQFTEAYGPFSPSVERQLRNPARDKAYEREIARRRNELVDEYKWRMDNEEVEPFSDEELFNYYDRQARNEIDDWLEYRQDYRLPIKPRGMYSRPLSDSKVESIRAFDEEDARDRFRMRGVPEIDLRTIFPPWRR